MCFKLVIINFPKKKKKKSVDNFEIAHKTYKIYFGWMPFPLKEMLNITDKYIPTHILNIKHVFGNFGTLLTMQTCRFLILKDQ